MLPTLTSHKTLGGIISEMHKNTLDWQNGEVKFQ